jgi:hypothetical protein
VVERRRAGPSEEVCICCPALSTTATRRRRRRWAILAGLLLLIVLALVGAYLLGDANSGEESEGEGEASVACSGDSITPNLPSDFPQVESMTYTKSETSGPSEVADGYFEGDLQGAYDAWKSAFEGAAGYTITFDEVEEFDSEVAYSGGAESRSGIVALRDVCNEDGRISVHITSRPA